MTLEEFQEAIATSPNKEWFQNYEITINTSPSNEKIQIKGAVSIFEFLEKQIEGFSTIKKLPTEFEIVRNTFIRSKNDLINLIKLNNTNTNQWNNDLNRNFNPNLIKFLWNFPETNFLIKVFTEYPKYYPGAFEYLSSTNLQHTSNKDYVTGYILAYEFTAKDATHLSQRIDEERKSLNTLREEFQKKLEESERHLIEYIGKTNEKYINYSQKLDEFKVVKENDYNGWFEKASKNVEEFEKLYREKLKLEAPAKYWSDRAKKLRREGYWWLGGLVFMVVAGVIMLVWGLSEISTGTLARIFQNSGTAIKWSVVFITLISFLAFAIRIFSKLTFSSFHLVRDAEEREQLTYVYLALKKEKGIDETERHLIMQSLFSRADTGLLKDDAGPTMPGSIVDNIIRK